MSTFPRPLHQRIVAFAAAAGLSLGILAIAFQQTARAAGHSRVLPPVVRRALGLPGTHWVRAESAQVAVYAQSGSRAAADVGRARAEAEAARASNLALLGEPIFETQLHVVYVGRREQMRPIVGATPGGTAEPEQFAVIMVANDSVRPPVRHELMHVMAWNAWGPPHDAWLREGLAMYAGSRCAGRSLHAAAAALDADRRLMALADLERRFDVRGEEGAAMYMEAGSLVKFVGDTYGRTRLRDFYRSGLDSAPASLGVPVPALEKAWRATVARSAGRERWKDIHAAVVQHGCE